MSEIGAVGRVQIKWLLVPVRLLNTAVMTTQEKTAAIQNLVTNYEDNIAAKNAAHLSDAVDELVIGAIANAFKADLEKIFAFTPPKARKGR